MFKILSLKCICSYFLSALFFSHTYINQKTLLMKCEISEILPLVGFPSVRFLPRRLMPFPNIETWTRLAEVPGDNLLWDPFCFFFTAFASINLNKGPQTF